MLLIFFEQCLPPYDPVVCCNTDGVICMPAVKCSDASVMLHLNTHHSIADYQQIFPASEQPCPVFPPSIIKARKTLKLLSTQSYHSPKAIPSPLL